MLVSPDGVVTAVDGPPDAYTLADHLPVLDDAGAARVVALIAAARGAEPPPATAAPVAAVPESRLEAPIEVIEKVRVSILGRISCRRRVWLMT